MAELIGTVMEVVKLVGAPIKRKFTDLYCFSDTITSLENEAKKLKVTAEDLQGKVDRAKDDLRVISPEVEDCLKDYDDIKSETDGILNEVPSVESGWLKVVGRYSLSKRARKTIDGLKELQHQCKKFEANAISQPGPPVATTLVPLPTTYEFESRKQIEEDIMTTLHGGDVNIMGICGMGGVGKTTMAERIRNKTLENNVFNEAVMVVVSQPVDKLKIQLEIGRSLGLKKLDEESTESRRQKLHERLSRTKRILLVLDDVWKKLELEEVGIPCNHKACTILITSRNRNVFKDMDVRDGDVSHYSNQDKQKLLEKKEMKGDGEETKGVILPFELEKMEQQRGLS